MRAIFRTEASGLCHITKIGDDPLHALPGIDDGTAFDCNQTNGPLRSATFAGATTIGFGGRRDKDLVCMGTCLSGMVGSIEV
jgi:hypothetical protein